jgi:LPXTG-motif cell wall-anchored protein
MTTPTLLVKPKALFILILLILIIIPYSQVQAEEKEIDIITNPSGYSFKVGNLKPGDWMPRDIMISNNGKQDFKYTSIIGKKKSVKGLFEELELLVKKDSTTLYEGKMKDFEGFTPRPLKKGQSETLFLQVTMPYELGNAFQDSSAEVEILFIAEALDGGGDPPGEGDPPGDGDPPGEDNPGADPGDNPGDEDPPGEDNQDGGDNEDPPGEDNQDGGDNGEDSGDGDSEDPEDDNPSEDPGDDSGDPSDNPDEPASGNPGSDPDDGDGITVTPEIRENILPDTATNTYNYMLLGGLLLGAGGILLAVRYRRIRKDH